MNRRRILGSRALAILSSVLLLSAVDAHAREMRAWTYEDLARESDLVVIAQPVSQRLAGERALLTESIFPPLMVDWVETTLSVLAVLKGSMLEKTIVLYHARLHDPDEPIINGPSFVEFDLSSRRTSLMFLKHGTDDRFVAVTGQVDPEISIKELSGDLMP